MIEKFGLLRVLLLCCVVLIVAAAPFADGQAHLHGWRFFPSVLAPSLMLLLVFILPLDITMTRVFMSDADAERRARLKSVIRTEALFLVVLVLSWLPFVYKLMKG